MITQYLFTRFCIHDAKISINRINFYLFVFVLFLIEPQKLGKDGRGVSESYMCKSVKRSSLL